MKFTVTIYYKDGNCEVWKDLCDWSSGPPGILLIHTKDPSGGVESATGICLSPGDFFEAKVQ